MTTERQRLANAAAAAVAAVAAGRSDAGALPARTGAVACPG